MFKKISYTLTALALTFIMIGAASATDGTYDNYEKVSTVRCGGIDKIPAALPKIISIAYILVQIAVPVVLIIWGSIDLIKGVIAQKEDEIKRAQSTFFKRLIAAVLVFFVFTVVKVVIGLTTKNSETILECAKCFIRNDCKGADKAKKEYQQQADEHKTWYCALDNYTFVVSTDSREFAMNLAGKNGIFSIDNEAGYKPSELYECPSDSEYTAGVDGDTFYLRKK